MPAVFTKIRRLLRVKFLESYGALAVPKRDAPGINLFDDIAVQRRCVIAILNLFEGFFSLGFKI